MAVLTIVGDKLLAATYNLEGDQCCAIVAYETIKDCESWLIDHFDHLSYPGLTQELNDCAATLLDERETYKGMNAEILIGELEDKAKVILMNTFDTEWISVFSYFRIFSPHTPQPPKIQNGILPPMTSDQWTLTQLDFLYRVMAKN